MRRLRRAHQRYVTEVAKRSGKLKSRALAAGTAAAITLVTGMSASKPFAESDKHQLPVSRDVDGDLLANKEELAIGYRVFEGGVLK
jgi:hypothetical protein